MLEHRQRLCLACASLVIVVAGCASVPAPRQELAAGDAALDSARVAEAQQLAPTEFDLARRKLEDAHAQSKSGNQLQAQRLAEQAIAQAQVALAAAQAERARRSVSEVEAGVRALRDELSRNPPAASSTPVAPATRPVAPATRP